MYDAVGRVCLLALFFAALAQIQIGRLLIGRLAGGHRLVNQTGLMVVVAIDECGVLEQPALLFVTPDLFELL